MSSLTTRIGRSARFLATVATFAVIAGYATLVLSDRSAHLTPGSISLGRNAPLGGRQLLPPDNAWNTRVDSLPVDPQSAQFIHAMGEDLPLHADFGPSRSGLRLYGIPYVVVDSREMTGYRVRFENVEESDTIEYPIPPRPPMEAGGDRHLLVLDRTTWRLYELFHAARTAAGWQAGSGAVFDLASNQMRPLGWTSADAAGLPILPGLARADEVYDGKEVTHALRFTMPRTQRAARFPARHFASQSRDSTLPPMGLRVRLRATIDPLTFPEGARVIVRALQQYGMLLADNGGPWFVSGTADRRWRRADLSALNRLRGSDFEVVESPEGTAGNATRTGPVP